MLRCLITRPLPYPCHLRPPWLSITLPPPLLLPLLLPYYCPTTAHSCKSESVHRNQYISYSHQYISYCYITSYSGLRAACRLDLHATTQPGSPHGTPNTWPPHTCVAHEPPPLHPHSA